MEQENRSSTAYLLLDRSFHFEIINVQTAFCLFCLSGPPSRTLARIAFAALNRTMPVTDTAIALVEQLVTGYLVFLDVPLDEVEVPRKEGVQFN